MSEWVAGLSGGCAGVLVGHPFDTVKVKLQTQDFRNPRYRGTWDCFAQTVRRDGVKGLYRGMASPLVGVGAVNAIIFGVQGAVCRQFQDQDALRTHFVAGVTAGLAQSFISSPVELAKIRLQIQADAVTAGSGAARYKGPLHCLTEIHKTEGIRGIFRGQMVTCFREMPAFGLYFLTFEWMSRRMTSSSVDGQPSALTVLTAGGMAGTASWLISYPMDVVKTRIQSDGAFGPARYKGITHCLRMSVQEEGLSVLSRGLTSTILRAFPTNAATFFVVTHVMKYLNKEGDDNDSGINVLKDVVVQYSESVVKSACIHSNFVYNCDIAL